MNKNKRFYLPPVTGNQDIKELFRFAASSGIGKPSDASGLPPAPWTTDELLEALGNDEHMQSPVDQRTVQLWFQPNDRGISAHNIRWLARIFGCGDPAATTEWQAALFASQHRLIRRRRDDRSASRGNRPSFSQGGASQGLAPAPPDIEGENIETADLTPHVGSPTETQNAFSNASPKRSFVNQFESRRSHESDAGGDNSIQPPTARSKRRLPARLEVLFADPIILPVVVWFWLTGILFLAAMLGVLSVSYTTPDGTSKQVGYLWSPSWIIHDLVLLPVFLMVVSSVITFWKNDARLLFLNARSKPSAHEGWLEKVNALSILHWAALAISGFFVFLLQWVGGYVFPILNNEMGNAAVSWVNIILARPDIMSVGSALALSGFYFLFAAIVFFFLNAGFVFLYAVWSDFSDLYKNATTM